MKATDIIWDVDSEEELDSLPTEVDIPDGMTDEEAISDYLSDLTGFCHRGFSLSTDPTAEDADQAERGKESKADRFRRVAEARVNKIIKMIRLLGNCSNPVTYEHKPEQVEQIFTVLQRELELAQQRYVGAAKNKKRFSLSANESDKREEPAYPTIYLSLPDGTRLRARAIDDENFPAVNIDLLKGEETELICFAEFNPEQKDGSELCIGVYQNDQDDTVYYKPYKAERDSI